MTQQHCDLIYLSLLPLALTVPKSGHVNNLAYSSAEKKSLLNEGWVN